MKGVVRTFLSFGVSLTLAGCVVSTRGGPGAELDVPPTPKPVWTEQPESAEGGEVPSEQMNETISARHLLVSYRGALRAGPHILRSREEAYARAQEALTRAQRGEAFETLVAEYSDDLGSAAKQGSLGEFRRQDMVGEFSEAAFALQPGQLSEIVETAFGFHVILRDK